MDLQGWINANIAGAEFGKCEGVDWSFLFGIATWTLWNWRNQLVFSEEATSSEPVEHTVNKTKQLQRLLMSENFNLQGRSKVKDRWIPPPQGWLKLNTDGACVLTNERSIVGAGGIIRDEKGRWVAGFVHHIGSCDSETAELWGLHTGLSLAWESNFRRINVELDSQSAVKLILDSEIAPTSHRFVVLSIRNLLRRAWEVDVQHIPRKANKCADHLAKQALKKPQKERA